jgi:hypothetical protein
MSRPTRACLLALTAVGLLVAGCGDDDENAAETGTTTTEVPEEETTATTAPEAEPAEVTTITATAVDYAFQTEEPLTTVAPGLVRVDLTNTGTEEHQATLIRLNDGVTLEQFIQGATADETGVTAFSLFTGYGGPNAAAPSGGTSSSTQALVEGNYLMICFIPSPADGVPHAAKGMVTPFTVVGEAPAVEAALPDDDVAGAIELADFAFTVPEGFDGQGTFAVTNNGPQQHELTIYALAEGATVDQALDFFGGEASGAPPVASVGGLAAVDIDVTTYIELDLEPGEYAFVCFLPDTEGSGAPHFTRGMAQQVSITLT